MRDCPAETEGGVPDLPVLLFLYVSEYEGVLFVDEPDLLLLYVLPLRLIFCPGSLPDTLLLLYEGLELILGLL